MGVGGGEVFGTLGTSFRRRDIIGWYSLYCRRLQKSRKQMDHVVKNNAHCTRRDCQKPALTLGKVSGAPWVPAASWQRVAASFPATSIRTGEINSLVLPHGTKSVLFDKTAPLYSNKVVYSDAT